MHTKSAFRQFSVCAALLGACTSEPVVVASNQSNLIVDKVDLLLVVDDSGSMAAIQRELPALLDKLVAGSDAPGAEFPALTDIHVAVVSTDMGVSQSDDPSSIPGCKGLGDDGHFVPLSADDLAECHVSTPSYLAFDGNAANAASVDTVACIPDLGTGGCGFEQPLESMLKSLWPASDDSVQFVTGSSHGDGDNAGFLRPDSLLIVMTVTDEDDCSAEDPSLFDGPSVDGPLADVALNLRCPMHTDYLHDVERYVDGLRNLRGENNHVLFVVLGGIPPELVDKSAQAAVAWDDAKAVDAYYQDILDSPLMQQVQDPAPVDGNERILPSCKTPGGVAFPPRRLVQVAKRFGKAGVLGSVCADDLSTSMANVIRAAAENL
jgi:hypothetical protein